MFSLHPIIMILHLLNRILRRNKILIYKVHQRLNSGNPMKVENKANKT
jgi:hypothetical protein